MMSGSRPSTSTPRKLTAIAVPVRQWNFSPSSHQASSGHHRHIALHHDGRRGDVVRQLDRPEVQPEVQHAVEQRHQTEALPERRARGLSGTRPAAMHSSSRRSAVNRNGGISCSASFEVMKLPAQARQISATRPSSRPLRRPWLDGNAGLLVQLAQVHSGPISRYTRSVKKLGRLPSHLWPMNWPIQASTNTADGDFQQRRECRLRRRCK